MSFVHLHLHTEYSLLDGVQKVRPLLEKVKSAGMNACALTDHGVMYGTYEFWITCKELGIKPILGCEVYVAKRSRHDKVTGIDNERYHLTLLAKNKVGYHNLLKMVSQAHVEGFYYKPRIDAELIEQYGKGVIALTGCLGSNFNQHIMAGEEDKAKDWLKFLVKNFEDVYVELQRNGIKESDDILPTQKSIAEEFKLPVVATCDSHYLEKEDFKIQEIAWCIGDGTKLNDPRRRQYGSTEFYVKTPSEMQELFKDIPEAITNTQKLADSVEEYGIEFTRVQPKFDTKLDVEQTRELLRDQVYNKVHTRYQKITAEIKTRIDYELEIIGDKGYNDYFLVVYDFCNWARENGIIVGPGRGSGAGSIVAYILGITALDPLRWNLIFERFLNPERPSPPDFDIDFQDDRRDELFQYMSERYGVENTSFIGTFGRLKTKAAIRDVARVMGIDLSIADKLSKMVIVKFGKVYPIKKMRESVREFDNMIKASPELEELAGYVSKLENVARHVSKHACGYLVTPTPITDYVPIQIETKGGDKKITQIEGQHIEPMGLMKFDFLGLTNLTIISKTIKLVERLHGITIDIDKLPLEDKRTFELFQRGDTTGVFQFESEGMKKYLRDLKPTEIEDLIFMNAAYRPGPMQYIPDYIARKQKKQKVKYLDKSLIPILENTYGFAIYQEQVINIAVTFAGYSLGEADILRRAMGKKKVEVMAKEKEKFIAKSQEKGYTKEKAEAVFAYLEPFADYGFNRSHSACYSIIAYQTAYLKANYPLEFMASIMETDADTPEKLEKDLKESREMQIEILAPNVNSSLVEFNIEDGNKIRFGLAGIKGGGEKCMEALVAERLQNGPFLHADDLISRVGCLSLSKKDLECLIKVGAMDEFGNRNQLLAIVPLIFDRIAKSEKSQVTGQSDFFSMNTEAKQVIGKTPLPAVPEETELERITWEKELLGTFLSSHPLSKFQELYKDNQIISLKKANEELITGKFKTLAIINRIKVIMTKKSGQAMAFLELADLDSKAEGVVFPESFKNLQSKNLLKENIPLVLSVTGNLRDDKYALLIDDVKAADVFQPEKIIEINISKEEDKAKLEKLKSMIINNPGTAKLKIVYGNSFSTKELEKEITPTDEMLAFIEPYLVK